MSLVAGNTKLAELTCDEFKELIATAVEIAVSDTAASNAPSEFLCSRRCAELLGVTPEHLCAMRSRCEGPPWSGAGKWIRYRRREALAWLQSLPRSEEEESAETSESRRADLGAAR